jgi:hypothetical protein
MENCLQCDSCGTVALETCRDVKRIKTVRGNRYVKHILFQYLPNTDKENTDRKYSILDFTMVFYHLVLSLVFC